MTTLTQPLQDHHKHCDELFAVAEERAHAEDWPGCAEAFAAFGGELEAHFGAEEQVLFTALEAATGTAAGPTQVMRSEHAQMRELLKQMAAALQQRDRQAFAGTAETLLILMEQHNMKEEHILYPICNNSLDSSLDMTQALCARA